MIESTSLPLEYFYRKPILNFAHRGARLQAPENTIPAFELAVQLGADGIEFDVHLCKDKVPVVIHDFKLDKTTNGTGPVKEKTLVELRELDAGITFSEEFAGTPIPTLDEVFEVVGNKLLLNLELKSTSFDHELAAITLERIHAHNLDKRVIISSFNPVTLRQVKRLNPAIPVGSLYTSTMPFLLFGGVLAKPLIGRHEARHPHYSMVDKKYMQWARANNYRVNVWTVNDADDIRRMMALGVDLIMSDAPDLVQGILNSEN